MRNININASVYSILFTERAEQANTIKRAIETGVFLSTKTGKPVKVNSLDSFNRYLKQQHGRVQVGQGYYSDAYVGGEGLGSAEYVLKVKRRARHGETDHWFDTYGPYCYQNKPTNPLFPKVLYIGQPVWSDQPIAFVEKLKFDIDVVTNLVRKHLGSNDPKHMMRIAVELYTGTRTFASDMVDKEKFTARFNLLLNEMGSNSKDFEEFANALVGMARPSKFDMHGNNMGWRANGELVISDPLA